MKLRTASVTAIANNLKSSEGGESPLANLAFPCTWCIYFCSASFFFTGPAFKRKHAYNGVLHGSFQQLKRIAEITKHIRGRYERAEEEGRRYRQDSFACTVMVRKCKEEEEAGLASFRATRLTMVE